MKKTVLMILFLCAVMLLAAGCKPGREQKPPENTANLGNPWIETDKDGFVQKLGLDLNIPAGAKDVVFRVNEGEKLGEMNFTLDGIGFNARVKPAGTFEDISGMNYTWDHVEEGNLHWHQEKHMKGKDGDQTVEVFLWHDVVPGIMYSLSCKQPDADGFDITAVALMVYKPMQGNA